MAERKEKRATLGRANSKKATKKVAAKIVSKKTTKKVTKKTTKTVSKAITSKSKKASDTTKKTSYTATKKALAKKTAKKVAKKVTKKVTKKTALPKSKATPKISSKSSQITLSDSKKLEKKKPRYKKLTDEVSIDTSNTIGVTKEGVTIFSRVRTKNMVMLVARSFALFFIFSGVFFTLLGLSRTETLTRPLSFISDLDKVLFEANVVNSTTYTVAGTVSKPVVEYNFPTTPISGITRVAISAEAEDVKARLVSVETGDDYTLDNPETTDYLVWKLQIDTEKYPDGDYKLSLVIKSGGETFYDKSTDSLTIENVVYVDPVDDVVIDDTVASTSITVSTTNDIPEKLSDLDFYTVTAVPSELNDKLKVVFKVREVVVAKTYAFNKDTKVRYDFETVQTDVNRWYYLINPEGMPDGDYRVVQFVEHESGHTLKEETIGFKLKSATNATTGVDVVADEKDESLTADETDVVDDTEEVVEDTTKTVDAKAEIFITEKDFYSGKISVLVKTTTSTFAEIYARRVGSLRDDFIGLAKREGDYWKYILDTTQLPNGAYKIISKHKNDYGFFYSEPFTIKIYNPEETELTQEQEEYVDTIKEVKDELANNDYDEIVVASSNDEEEEAEEVFESTTDNEIENEEERSVRVAADEYLYTIREELRALVQEYSVALRNEDSAAAKSTLLKIEALKREAREGLVEIGVSEDIFDAVDKRISDRIAELAKQTESANEVIKERVGEATTRDSDNDGITDYDEVVLYKTDPFSADTDKDGFTDQAEILGGFDPNDSRQEAAIAYESPRESGVVREDILSVDSIVTDELAEEISNIDVVDEENTASDTPDVVLKSSAAAIISGKGMPNSFVTLYIFSTPIVVTVRTEDDGSWSYRFNKELEDGEHEVYVGVTDNSGKLVAKSNPLTFVKEAQAFTAIDAEAASATITNETAEPSLFDGNGLLIAGASVLISLGFVLLLISLFIKRNEETEEELSRQRLINKELAHG